jgi:hypothetical protein
MTTPLHLVAAHAARVIGNMSKAQERSTEWHREYREKNPTARQRKREASQRYRLRKKLAEQQPSEVTDGTSD